MAIETIKLHTTSLVLKRQLCRIVDDACAVSITNCEHSITVSELADIREEIDALIRAISLDGVR